METGGKQGAQGDFGGRWSIQRGRERERESYHHRHRLRQHHQKYREGNVRVLLIPLPVPCSRYCPEDLRGRGGAQNKRAVTSITSRKSVHLVGYWRLRSLSPALGSPPPSENKKLWSFLFFSLKVDKRVRFCQIGLGEEHIGAEKQSLQEPLKPLLNYIPDTSRGKTSENQEGTVILSPFTTLPTGMTEALRARVIPSCRDAQGEGRGGGGGGGVVQEDTVTVHHRLTGNTRHHNARRSEPLRALRRGTTGSGGRVPLTPTDQTTLGTGLAGWEVAGLGRLGLGSLSTTTTTTSRASLNIDPTKELHRCVSRLLLLFLLSFLVFLLFFLLRRRLPQGTLK
ncbi:hypothetical protein O3P69_000067 [Scylla paramamosain]|uniref:Uncharacterized protein n=1 Tax=Scylla paramamosain TaxID=85552 RepID=A0AAW0UXE8_SCYPA